jgi:hypothetical protein
VVGVCEEVGPESQPLQKKLLFHNSKVPMNLSPQIQVPKLFRFKQYLMQILDIVLQSQRKTQAVDSLKPNILTIFSKSGI